jgi:hypothetical protein
MNKRTLHHHWRLLSRFSTWYLLAALVLVLSVSVFARRNNNLSMIRLRNEVYRADEQNGDIETALRNLRAHVHSHMNTDLLSGSSPIKPPIQLKYSYERAIKAEKDRVSAINERVYAEAQAECERRIPTGLSGGGRVPCVQQYVTDNGTVEKPVPTDFYTFDFVSPAWTPDLAGWSLVAAGVLTFLIPIKMLIDYLIIRTLKQHQ